MKTNTGILTDEELLKKIKAEKKQLANGNAQMEHAGNLQNLLNEANVRGLKTSD